MLAGLSYKLKTPSGNRDGEVSASSLISRGEGPTVNPVEFTIQAVRNLCADRIRKAR